MAGPEHAVLAKQRTADVVWRIRSVRHADRETAPRGSVVFHVLQVAEGARDPGLAAVSRAQDDLVTQAQLRTLGLGRAAVAHRVLQRRLHPVLPRVFAYGSGLLTPRGRQAAALLWAGDGVVLSHASAAWLWGLTDGVPDLPAITVVGRHVTARTDVQVHCLSLDSPDIRLRCGLPTTAPPVTLVDLASEATDDAVASALAAARLARLVSDHELEDVMRRHPRRHGLARLRRVLATDAGATVTRSEAERRFLKLVADAELPRPEVNVQVGAMEVDFLWRPERLVVEVDGWRHHSGRAKWEHDRWRDQRLTALGLRVMRVTWRQLTQTPMAVAVRLAQALASGPSGPRRAG